MLGAAEIGSPPTKGAQGSHSRELHGFCGCGNKELPGEGRAHERVGGSGSRPGVPGAVEARERLGVGLKEGYIKERHCLPAGEASS